MYTKKKKETDCKTKTSLNGIQRRKCRHSFVIGKQKYRVEKENARKSMMFNFKKKKVEAGKNYVSWLPDVENSP